MHAHAVAELGALSRVSRVSLSVSRDIVGSVRLLVRFLPLRTAAHRGRRQLEEEGDLDPRDDSGDGGATCRRCTRPKATFELSRTFVGERGHVVVLAPAQELTRRARQQSARWKCSGRGQEAGMLGPRGENPRASTAEVRGTRTIMRASTQESAFARERRGAPSALSNELFHDRNRG